jgi:hypothetical protein
VHLLLAGTKASVLLNGWRTDVFGVSAGIGQGSPLSPLLYTIAAHPLACLLAQEQRKGVLCALPSPGTQIPPPCHFHADDTTLHNRDIPSTVKALAIVEQFCLASNSQLNRAKSHGLLFGPGPVWSGLDGATGITFSSPTSPIRHLGILLGHNPSLCAKQMYEVLAGRMQRGLGRWSARQLSFLGRVYVAKQCLASMLYFHASFVPPPGSVSQHLTQLLTAYISGAASSPGLGRKARLFPRRPTCALDWGLGGVRLADLNIAFTALQAKVMARLLEPPYSSWKPFMAAWFDRPSVSQAHNVAGTPVQWGAGLAALFTTQVPSTMRLPHRVASYVAAFRALFPHRLPSPGPPDFFEVMCEPIFYNRQISANGKPLGGVQWRKLANSGLHRVWDLRAVCMGTAGDAIPISRRRAEVLQAALPPEWRRLLCAPEPAAPWLLDIRTDRVYRRPVGPFVGLPWASFLPLPSGQLLQEATCVFLPPPFFASLVPCRVVAWSPARTPRLGAGSTDGGPSPPSPLYLHGPWSSVHVAPQQWGMGTVAVTDYVVRGGAARLRTLRMVREDVTCKPGHTPRPKIWPTGDPLQGLAGLDARAAAAVLPPPPQAPLPPHPVPLPSDLPPPHLFPLPREPIPGSTSTEPSGVPVPPAPHPPHPAPLPPASSPIAPGHSRRRSRADMEAPRRAPFALLDDWVDLAAPSPAPKPPWQGVFVRIKEASLPRPHRAVAWRLLHGALLTRASRVQHGLQLTRSEGCCPRRTCVGLPETLTHLFLTCPVSASVWEWVRGVWETVAGNPPPISAAVLLADDDRLWKPPHGARYLWTHLRLATIAAVWNAASRRDMAGRDSSAGGVAGAVLASVRQAMMHDWSRVTGGDLEGLGMFTGWVRGRGDMLSRELFAERWCFGGVLCTVPPGASRLLQMRWSASHPVPLPAGVG